MLGGRQLPPLPVALSLLTTFLSGILMLGVPTEMFQRGGLFFQCKLPSIPLFEQLTHDFLTAVYIYQANNLNFI